MEYTPQQQETIDRIAAVVNTPGEGRPVGPYANASDWEMRQLYAESWLNVGFTDPQDVARWIEHGIYDAGIAYDAYRAGFTPDDPWVQRSHSSFTPKPAEPLQAPSEDAARENRLAAEAAWLEGASRREARRSEPESAGHTEPISEGEVVGAFERLGRNTYVLRGAYEGLPELGTYDLPHADAELSGWLNKADEISSQLDACTPTVRRTIELELKVDRDWVEKAAKHYGIG